MDRRQFLQGTLLIAAALQGCSSMEPATSSAAGCSSARRRDPDGGAKQRRLR